MSDVEVAFSVYKLPDFLSRYYGKKVIILLDEYGTSFAFTQEEVFAALDARGTFVYAD